MNNEHGITPVGPRVLVLPDPIETKTDSGIITTFGINEEREKLKQVDGVVVAMGDCCFYDKPSPWCKVGDRVIFGKYSGIFRTGNDDKEYRIINDEDVVATLEVV